jgi:hypothetical protein
MFENREKMEVRIVLFWVVKPCSFVDDYQCFGGTYCLIIRVTSILKMETIRSSEKLESTYETIWCHN